MVIILSEGASVSNHLYTFHLAAAHQLTLAEVKKVGLTPVVFRQSLYNRSRLLPVVWVHHQVVSPLEVSV
jgi:hypothetical protein